MLDLGTLKIGVEVDDGAAKKELSGLTESVQDTADESNKHIEKTTGKLKSLVKMVAAAAITKKLVDVGKQAVAAYGQFEQLEGGVKKIFGEDTAKTVLANADKAYKTAGISANKYMEQVTSFSASLLQSVGGDTVKAAEVADMAIQDMADNANTYGTAMESIQNAYQGFAKQNYTMLDNLKLGYGGTKQEMERLLADAEKISGVKYDISNLNDVYEAIHVIQGELNITGTTAKEAEKTVEGSINAAKAAYENLLVGLGSGENVAELTKQFISSIGIVAKNLLPVVGNVVTGLVDAVAEIIPNLFSAKTGKFVANIVTFISTLPGKILPAIAKMLSNLADNISNGSKGDTGKVAGTVVSNLITGLLKGVPQLAAAGLKLILAVITGIVKAVPQLFVAAIEAVKEFARGIGEGHPLVSKAINLMLAPFKLIINIIKTVISWWEKLKNAIKKKITLNANSKALETAKKVIQGLISWWDKLKEKAKKVITFKTKTTSKAEDSGYPHRIGLKEVPYDNYPAILHKGETVLTAAETNQYRKYLDSLLKLKTGDEKDASTVNNDNTVNYHFGDITLDVSSLKDIPTIEDFVDMIKRVKRFA